jgi:hypothetical protein
MLFNVSIRVNYPRYKTVTVCENCPHVRELGLNANGPAIKGGCATRRRIRAESRYFSQEIVTVQGGYGMRFCSPGTIFIEHYECRGTSLIGARL